jgi:hypothetical protein
VNPTIVGDVTMPAQIPHRTVFRVVVRSVRWTRCLVRTLMWLLAIIVQVNVQLRVNIQMMNANCISYSVLFS